MFTYSAHGLSIASEIPLPELLSAETDRADVTIRYGNVPDKLEERLGGGVLYDAKSGKLLLQIADIAKYLVTDGSAITVERLPESTESDMRVFLYGSAFGALLHQRGTLALHGSAIETPHGAVVFIGQSGTGKSTLAGSFVKRGYRLLTDDICVVDTKSGLPVVHPAKPSIHLWADILPKLDKNPDNLERIRESIEKYRLPVEDQFASGAVPLLAVYLLTTSNTDELSLTPIEGGDRVGILVNNTYRVRFLNHLGVEGRHFMQTAQVAQNVRVSRVRRPQMTMLLDELVEMIEADFTPEAKIAN